MPRFSVVIPVYNRREYIAAVLRSALEQEVPPHEVIVVDDGSTDGSDEVVHEFGDAVQLYRQENQGCAVARNFGVQQSSGDYIAFLDSDDHWYPWTLRLVQEVIAQHQEPTTVATSQLDFSGDDPPVIPVPTNEDLTVEVYPDLLSYGRTVGTSVLVIRRDTFERVGGFVPRNVNATDSEFNLRTATEPGFVRILSPPMLAYRLHDTNVTHNMLSSWEGHSLLIDGENAGNFPGGRERSAERWRYITSKTRSLSVQTIGTKDAALGWDLYRRTFRWNLSLGRWKYIYGFPALALATKLGIGKRRQP